MASLARPTYRFSLALVPSRDEIPLVLNARHMVGAGVEVGVQRGAYSEYLLERWGGACLISVDPWLAQDPERYVDVANVPQAEQERNLAITSERLARFGGRSVIWRTTSVEAARRVDDGALDFVYLDARHDFDSVTEDLTLWFPKLRWAGILAGHDYYDGVFQEGIYGVKSAVELFAAGHGLRVYSTYQDRWPSWLTVKGGRERGSRILPLDAGARAMLLLLRSGAARVRRSTMGTEPRPSWKATTTETGRRPRRT